MAPGVWSGKEKSFSGLISEIYSRCAIFVHLIAQLCCACLHTKDGKRVAYGRGAPRRNSKGRQGSFKRCFQVVGVRHLTFYDQVCGQGYAPSAGPPKAIRPCVGFFFLYILHYCHSVTSGTSVWIQYGIQFALQSAIWTPGCTSNKTELPFATCLLQFGALRRFFFQLVQFVHVSPCLAHKRTGHSFHKKNGLSVLRVSCGY